MVAYALAITPFLNATQVAKNLSFALIQESLILKFLIKNKKIEKIGKIGNYCQFSIGEAFIMYSSSR